MKAHHLSLLLLAACSSSSGGAVHVDAGADASDAAPIEACTMVTHTDGLGGTWQDCAPPGTYTEVEALTACEIGTTSSCVLAVCTPDGGMGPMANSACGCIGGGTPGPKITCPAGSTCDCWGFVAPYAGLVSVSGTTACACEQIGGPTWQ